MKRKILSLVLACVMIFGVFSFVGCNDELKSQISDLEAQVNDLKNQSAANAAKADSAAADAAKALSNDKTEALESSIEAAIAKAQADLAAAQEALDAAIAQANAAAAAAASQASAAANQASAAASQAAADIAAARAALQAQINGAVALADWNAATAVIPGLLDDLDEDYENAVQDMEFVGLFTEGEFELLYTYYKTAKVKLIRATSVANANAVLDEFNANADSIRPIGITEIYNRMKQYVAIHDDSTHNTYITYEMRDDIVDLWDAYSEWLENSEKIPADFDAFILEKTGTALNPTFASTVSKYKNSVVKRSNKLETAEEEAADINADLAILASDINNVAPDVVKANWMLKEEIREAIEDWDNTYFTGSYAFEKPATQYPNGSVNYQLVDHALFASCEDTLFTLVSNFLAAARRFIASLYAIGDVNLLSYGRINAAKKAYNDLVIEKQIADFSFVFNVEGETLADLYDILAKKENTYKELVAEATAAYIEVVDVEDLQKIADLSKEDFKNSDNFDMKQEITGFVDGDPIEGIIGYHDGDPIYEQTGYEMEPIYSNVGGEYVITGYKQGAPIFDIVGYEQIPDYGTVGYELIPVYGDPELNTENDYPTVWVDEILAWFAEYGVWTEETEEAASEIVFTDEFATAWSWPENYRSVKVSEIVKDAIVTATDTVTGYVMGETVPAVAKTEDGYVVENVDALLENHYIVVAEFDLRVIIAAIEGLYELTPEGGDDFEGYTETVWVGEHVEYGEGQEENIVEDYEDVEHSAEEVRDAYNRKIEVLQSLMARYKAIYGENPALTVDLNRMFAIEVLTYMANYEKSLLTGEQAYELEGADIAVAGIHKILTQVKVDLAAAETNEEIEEIVGLTFNMFLAIMNLRAEYADAIAYVAESGASSELIEFVKGEIRNAFINAVLTEKLVDDPDAQSLLYRYAKAEGILGIENTVSLTIAEFELHEAEVDD